MSVSEAIIKRLFFLGGEKGPVLGGNNKTGSQSQVSPGAIVKIGIFVSDTVHLGFGLRNCIAIMFSGKTHVGLESTLRYPFSNIV